ncbi:MAG: tRNA (adenosine(37)-N6)-threonylcarbamoyltransferase complex ATPase subunit type 1 TsaE [Elusimicrobiota bacterium]
MRPPRALTASFDSDSERETMRLAARLAKRARPGSVLCLAGPLGSGKTTFARGFLRGLGFKGAVRSPTFVLINEYRKVRPPVYHVDLFRAGAGDLENTGLEECLCDPGAVCLIEWPEAALGLLPRDRLEIVFRHARGGGRGLRLRAAGPASRAFLKVHGSGAGRKPSTPGSRVQGDAGGVP